jgi:pimeloyl-ACP methyl ester carboxylesterase
METSWINREEYPFRSNYMDIDGNAIHYLDEGKGPILLMVHGIPEWSFTYRHIIKRLSVHYRCIIMDNLGFGLSDKPRKADYTHKAHTERLIKFIEKLDLRNIHLFVHDHGGPIGLGYAVQFPENIKSIILSQTWMWPLNDIPMFKPLKYLSGLMGRFLYINRNFSVHVMVPKSFGNKKKLTGEIHNHYKMPLNQSIHRFGLHQMMLEMLRAKDWYQWLWDRRVYIVNKPTLILWAGKDRFFPEEVVGKVWLEEMKNYDLVRLPESGHFIQEEAPIEVSDEIQKFLFKQ